MNCKAMEKYSVAYLDGSIDSRRRREVEAHLADCGPCRVRAHQFQEVWGILEEAPMVRPSASFDAAVRARVAQEASRSSLWGWLVAPSPRLAVGVTGLLVFSVWLSSLQPAARPPAQIVTAGDTEFKMIADLPVLEDYDVLANFEALSEVPVQPTTPTQPGL
jgi:anti-sigma factor RsiW